MSHPTASATTLTGTRFAVPQVDVQNGQLFSSCGVSPARGGANAEDLARLAQVRGLVFDMGDVLYDATAWRRWLLMLLGRMGLHTNYRCFFRIWDRDFLDDVHRGQREYQEALRAFLRSAGLSMGQIDEVEAASQARKRAIEGDARPFPGVRETLRHLQSAGVAMAVLTDSESSAPRVCERLAQFRLDGLFAAVISSVDLGYTKPAAVCYQSALDALGIEPAKAAFVGHDAEELSGAAAIGMTTIASNYDLDCEATFFLDRFSDLRDLAAPRQAENSA